MNGMVGRITGMLTYPKHPWWTSSFLSVVVRSWEIMSSRYIESDSFLSRKKPSAGFLFC